MRLSSFFQLFKYLAFLMVISLFAATSVMAQKPIVIKYGIQVQKINPNFKDGTFFTEFHWWMSFKNDSTVTGITFDEIMNLQYINASGVSPSGVKKEIQEVKRRGNHEYYVVGLHQGSFLFYPNYKQYPFDVQKLPIKIDHANLPVEQLVFELDTNSYIKSKQERNFWSLSQELVGRESLVYKIKGAQSATFVGTYNTDFGDIDFPPTSTMSRYVNEISIHRSIMPFISKLIIPLLFILCLTYMVFFIEADKFDSARGLSVTSMFSAFAFQMTATRDLPDVGYVIYVDKVFYLAYFLIAMSIVFVIIRYNIDKRKGAEEQEKNRVDAKIKIMNIVGKILFPIFFLGGAYLFAL